MNSLPILEKQWARSPLSEEKQNAEYEGFYVKLMNRNNLSAVV